MIVVPDTNVWLMWSGKPGWEKSFPAGAGQPSVLVATIVLQELLAGARNAAEREYFTALFRLARRYRKVINPPAAAWVLSGLTLAKLARHRRLGAARLRSLRNDVLLAATALAHGATVLTYNRADFTLISKVLPVEFRAPERAG